MDFVEIALTALVFIPLAVSVVLIVLMVFRTRKPKVRRRCVAPGPLPDLTR